MATKTTTFGLGALLAGGIHDYAVRYPAPRVGTPPRRDDTPRVEASSGGGPGWIFGAPALALDAFAVWLARAGAPTPAPRPSPPDGPGKPPKGPPAKRRRPPRPPTKTLARAA
jgi:hypothetical protein